MSRASASLIAEPGHGGERPGEEIAAEGEALAIDAVAEAAAHVELDRDVERAETLRREEQRLGRDDLVLVAMHEQDRRPRRDLRPAIAAGPWPSGATRRPE